MPFEYLPCRRYRNSRIQFCELDLPVTRNIINFLHLLQMTLEMDGKLGFQTINEMVGQTQLLNAEHQPLEIQTS